MPAIMNPAMAGPIRRAPFTSDEFMAMALGRSSLWSTIRITKDCRAGISKELIIPCRNNSRIISVVLMTPEMVSAASSSDCTMEHIWATMTVLRRSQRSTQTPANGPTSKEGS